jgi:2,4-dienoyl-CoA reductase-like NADH-dependent reductase (Old Yellow Enzyme family)
LLAEAADLGLALGAAPDLRVLGEPVHIPGSDLRAPNRLVIHPMEGCDGTSSGSPGALTVRRYERFGGSGAGLLWFEATAVLPEARANPRQLMLTHDTAAAFQALISRVDVLAARLEEDVPELAGKCARPLKILQLTHSGRYSRPEGRPAPIRAYPYEPLDTAQHQTPDQGRVITDEELDALPDAYVTAARLAKEAGFDGVDIKACHRYLINALLSGVPRPGPFGGDALEARARPLLEIVRAVRQAVGSPRFLVTTRLNAYDGLPYPYGFGVARGATEMPASLVPKPDPAEPIRLLEMLHAAGVRITNITIGNPYYNPFISRPFDTAPTDRGTAPEHPLMGVHRFLDITRRLRAGTPRDLLLVGTGYSWLRQWGPHVGAAEVQAGHVDLVGFGRMAFAYPTFARDILAKGALDPHQVCVTCSKCTALMRYKTTSGCVVRDGEVYRPILRAAQDQAD